MLRALVGRARPGCAGGGAAAVLLSVVEQGQRGETSIYKAFGFELHTTHKLDARLHGRWRHRRGASAHGTRSVRRSGFLNAFW